MINKSLERRPDTRPLNRHLTKGNKIFFFIQKKTHPIFRGAPTLLYKKLSYKMNHYWGEEWHTCKDHIVPILSRSRLLKILLEQSTDLRTCKVIVSPWYDTDYGGVRLRVSIWHFSREITLRPKTYPHKRYSTKGKI